MDMDFMDLHELVLTDLYGHGLFVLVCICFVDISYSCEIFLLRA
jgi:hypothetical protein